MSVIGTNELTDLAGISHRQFNLWCREGILRCGLPGQGNPRKCTERDLLVATAIGRLTLSGASMETLRDVGRALYEESDPQGLLLVEPVNPRRPGPSPLSDGAVVTFCTDEIPVVEIGYVVWLEP